MTTSVLTRVEADRKELFLLVVRALADAGDPTLVRRLADVAVRLASADEEWTTRLADWMSRHPALARLRLALVAELAHARIQARATRTRSFVDRALRRADEPGELLAYWLGRYGRSLPQPLKRGVADAVVRLYDEPAVATYDGPGASLRFADVLALTHPVPRDGTQSALFALTIARRRGLTHDIPPYLTLLRARRELYRIAADRRAPLLDRPDGALRLASAAMTWSSVRRWLLGTMTGAAWAAVLPTMSYRERLAHLADLDRAGVSAEVAAWVAADLADPASVARAGATPLDVVAAVRAVPDSRWSAPLGRALEWSLGNVPALPGRTLVLVDRSDLMAGPCPAARSLTRADAAAVFGAALALRAVAADLVSVGAGSPRVPATPGDGPLDVVARFGRPGGSTGLEHALRRHLDGHDRVVILTHPSRAGEVAGTVAGRQHVVTAITGGAFTAIPYVEAAGDASWPF
ncbi:TROVE domain-containing protein [Microbispora corallina]|uniref:RNA-binding protein n=1 Tax=Microbispora corallina TaxID=83302 RepID=A0ABQ4G8D3_9ACTN|nr:TROVE domain-containing protein [Microbispora corallina]GIH43336.1 RNA-binding protein [Microbispora corallina]